MISYRPDPADGFTSTTTETRPTVDPEVAAEDAQRLWDLTASRLSGLLELASVLKDTPPGNSHLRQALEDERKAFRHWQRVCELASFPFTQVAAK